ncbi:tautomerase family protein [Nonomuraea sp. NPDC050022]|uniref:tautomerase family protein n=1 Tax=unclassified Nonomuraea TaxID=2593643 RepID=UPI003402FF22
MPLVGIDMVRGRRPDQVKAVVDAVHHALVEVLGIPVGVRRRGIADPRLAAIAEGGS